MKRSLSALILATALVGGSANAAESGFTDSASFTINFTADAQVVCRASLDATVVPANAGQTSLGNLNEFCNNAAGYQVFVEGSPELADATLVVDGRAVTLSGDGPTLVAASNGPDIVSRNVSLASNGGGGSLSFRIVPL